MKNTHLTIIAKDIQIRVETTILRHPRINRHKQTPTGMPLNTLFKKLDHLLEHHQESTDSLLIQKSLFHIQQRMKYAYISRNTMAIILYYLEIITRILEGNNAESTKKSNGYKTDHWKLSHIYPEIRISIYTRFRSLLIKPISITTPITNI